MIQPNFIDVATVIILFVIAIVLWQIRMQIPKLLAIEDKKQLEKETEQKTNEKF